MWPTAQAHQRSRRQEGWQSEDPYALAGVSSSSSASHANTTFIPLPPAAPALPPLQPDRLGSVPSPTASSFSSPYPHVAPTSSRVPAIFQARPQSPNVPLSPRPQEPPSHMSAHPPQSPIPQRLVNPYEQNQLPNPYEETQLVNPYERREPSLASPAPSVAPNPTRSNAPRLSFGPGDPLFSGPRASLGYPDDRIPQPSPSPRPSSMINTVSPPIPAHRTMSSASAHQAATSRPVSNTLSSAQHQTASGHTTIASHGGPGHEFDDCPGCRAEMEEAIKASLQSAQQETEIRQRELREQAELDRIYAMTAEENERQRRLAQEEEQLLQKAIEDSRREAEVQLQRKTQEDNLLLEESRQYALRQHEQDARLEVAKLASATQEQTRRKELDAMQVAERRALQLSLQEQEEEWARRESAERSLLEFLDHRNVARSTTPLSSAGPSTPVMASHLSGVQASSQHQGSSSSTTVGLSSDLDAEYWRFAGHDEAYQLALQMQQASLNESPSHSFPGPSSSRARRPLPQAPAGPSGSNAVAGPPIVPPSKLDPRPVASQPATLYTVEEAPPAYTQSSENGRSQADSSRSQLGYNQAGPSTRASYVSEVSYDAYPTEKVSSPRYDAHALQNLNRPVLQQRSFSSSSGHSQTFGRLSATPSLSNEAVSPLPSPPPTSSEDSSSAPPMGPASPSIPGRGSSQTTPASKRYSQSGVSLNSEQRGQRALAGIEFGYSNLPFAPKLDKSRLPFAASASTAASNSSCSTSASTGKVLFPASIELSNVLKAPSGPTGSDSHNSSSGSFFTIRAQSWKSLLRAIAWYGNSRIEAAPEEVATASDRRARCLLRVEVEFVTPTRVDLGYGVADYAKAAQNGVVPKNPSPAHVAMCLSLLPISSSKSSSSGEASAWLKSEEYQTINRESRRLDAWYAGRGSTRRLVQLPRQPPVLPVVLVQVAQLLHASHTFSAACPSTGSTARHSPRDLHHAIERHDEGFVRKQKAMLAAGTALATQSGALASTSSLTSANPRLSMQGAGRNSSSTDLNRDPEDDDDLDDDDDELDFNDYSMLENSLAANGSFDAQDRILMGRRQRLKAKVKRRLAKRNSDGRVVDEDLATWITPFDLSQHG